MISNVHFNTLNCLYSFNEKSFSFFSSFFSSLSSSFSFARKAIMTTITILTIFRRFSSIKSIILRREISSMIDVRRVEFESIECKSMSVEEFRFVEFESMSVFKKIKNEKKKCLRWANKRYAKWTSKWSNKIFRIVDWAKA